MLDFLLFIGMLGFIVGIVGAVKGEIKLLKIPNRKISFLVILASFVFMMITAGFMDTEPTSAEKEDEKVQETISELEDENEKKAEKKEKEDVEQTKAEEKSKTTSVSTGSASKTGKLNPLRVHFIDVGQADAALLEYSEGNKKYHILIDSGNWNSNATVNYLKQRGVKNIDLVVGSHPHADHIGQIDKVINEFKVDEVWMSGDTATSQVFERVINAIDKNNVGYNEPRAGEKYQIGSLRIEVLSPKTINGHLNNGSIVMKLTYGSVAFLFTGDAERAAEQGMLSRGHNLKSDVLKVGHHGSDTSNTSSFISAVKPKVAVISVGKNNQYGHPSASVISRLKNQKAELYSTKDHGTVIVETDGRSYKITTQRKGKVTPAGSKSTTSKTASTSNSNKATTKNQSSGNQSKKQSQPKQSTPSSSCVDINSASIEQVQQIKHIGPVRAPDLIKMRPYKSVDDLTKIKGIGPSRIKDIKAQGIACVR